MKKCIVCKASIVPVFVKQFVRKRNKFERRKRFRKTCSQKCAAFARGTHNRLPAGRCSVRGCHFFGKLDRTFCSKHYQHWWRHGRPTPPKDNICVLRLPKTHKIWIAAVIDCEGWIGAIKHCRGRNGAAYSLGIGVGNTRSELIDRIVKLTRCGYTRNVTPINPRAKKQYHWLVRRRSDVMRIAKTIRPFLILKRPQADLILQTPLLNARAATQRNALWEALRKLNRKGRP